MRPCQCRGSDSYNLCGGRRGNARWKRLPTVAGGNRRRDFHIWKGFGQQVRGRPAGDGLDAVYVDAGDWTEARDSLLRPRPRLTATMLAFATTDLSSPVRSRRRTVTHPSRFPSLSSLDNNQPSPIARTAIALEYASLRYPRHCPTGMYVTPSPESLLVWDVVFFVHQGFFPILRRVSSGALIASSRFPGYYSDSILKFRVSFPPNYPERPPTIQFLTDVFHPLISQQDGAFNIAPRFRPWRYLLSLDTAPICTHTESSGRKTTMPSTSCIGSKPPSRNALSTTSGKETA